jgi:Zn-dependent M28 family amino/carboxypeptidase
MSASDEGLAPSANVIAEIVGSERPEEVVVLGGHLDSWDVGQGAHDDGAGIAMSMEALNVIRKMGLKPRRTIRVVLWTNEENGLAGGKAYAADHASEMKNHIAAIETDSGGFRPESFGVECNDHNRVERAVKQLEGIAALMEPLGTIKINEGHSGADVSPMKPADVILMGLGVEGSTYFDYHHSQADTLDKVDPRQLSESTAALAVMSYILADMPTRLGD